MAPKDKNDGPKTKRVLTPEQLEKLAQARAKANEVSSSPKLSPRLNLKKKRRNPKK